MNANTGALAGFVNADSNDTTPSRNDADDLWDETGRGSRCCATQGRLRYQAMIGGLRWAVIRFGDQPAIKQVSLHP